MLIRLVGDGDDDGDENGDDDCEEDDDEAGDEDYLLATSMAATITTKMAMKSNER